MRTVASALALFIAGCSSASSWMRDSAPTAPPATGVAKVVFYRTPAFAGNKMKWEVWDGDRLAGFAENGGYFEYLCGPGLHLFHLMGGVILGEGTALEAELVGGKTYFIRVEVGTGLLAPPTGAPDERRQRDDDFGRCDCRELRIKKATEERLAGDREKARKHVEELRTTRASQVSKVRPEYGE